MARTGWTPRIAVTALAAALLVGGCSDGPDVVTTPPPTPTQSLSTSVTPSAVPTREAPLLPPAPEAMAANDQDGAIALAQYFAVDLYTYVFATGDLERWRALSDPSCAFCNGVIENAESMRAAGEFDDGEPAAVESAVGTTITEGSRYTATLVVRQSASKVRNADGEITAERTEERFQLHYAIAWDGGWRVLAVDATPLGA